MTEKAIEKKTVTQIPSAKTVTAKKSNMEKKKELVMYIGPTVKGVVFANTTFNNVLPEKLIEFVEENPAAGNLIVSVSRLSQARKELRDGSSALSICFKQILEKGRE